MDKNTALKNRFSQIVPLLTTRLSAQLTQRIPGLVHLHDDLRNQTLFETYLFMLQNYSLDDTELDQGTALKVSATILKRRIADMFRGMEKLSEHDTLTDLPGSQPNLEKEADQRAILKHLQTILDALTDDEKLLIQASVAGGGPVFNPAARQKLKRTRKKLYAGLTEKFGSEGTKGFFDVLRQS